jgi:FHA domain
MFGELIPVGGGDPIPLLKKTLLVGRRESCDIVLRFSNVSAHHCQLTVTGGYWYIRDMNSRNGVKVNGLRVTDKLIEPGDVISIAKHKYEMRYVPVDLGAVGPPPVEVTKSDIFNKSLLERAGLERPSPTSKAKPDSDRYGEVRYDITKDDPGQLRFRHQPR